MKGKASSRAFKKPKTILIFGEDDNDSHALKHLVEALRPGAARVETRRRPIILSKEAQLRKRDEMCREIVRSVAAARVISEVVSVIAHRDCDAIEPAHRGNCDALLRDMRAHELPQPIAATPAFELEAWWFLWPAALAAARPCWNPMRARGQVGNIANAKESLRRELRPKRETKCPDYTESDSRRIAENVKMLGVVRTPNGDSESFTDFVAQLDQIVL